MVAAPPSAPSPPRRLWLVLFYGAVMVLAGTLATISLPQPEGTLTLAVATFVPLSSLDQEVATAGGQPVALPHAVEIPGVNRFWGGAYHFSFLYSAGQPTDQPTDQDEPWSVLVPCSAGRLVIRLNGILLADSSQVHSSSTAVLNWPTLVAIPAPLLHPGLNQLEIREEVRIGRASYLSPIHLGADHLLRPVFRDHQLLQVTLPTLMVGWEFAFSLLLLLVWLMRPGEYTYLLFSLILLCAVANGLPFVAAGSLELEGLIRVLSSVCFLWQVALLLPFSFRFVGRPVPRWTWSLPLLPLLHTACLFLLPPDLFRWLTWNLVVPVAILICFGTTLVFVEAAFHRRSRAAHGISGALLLVLCLILHDIPILYVAYDGDRVFLGRFGMPGMLTVVGGMLMWRFAAALNTVDRFNAELHRQVSSAEAALRASLEREREQERANTREAERARLTRDLHDGLAGQLVSMVALSNREQVDPGAFGSAARKALADLRLVLASLVDLGDDLGMMLASFRDQLEPQLRGQGVTLEWHMSELPKVCGWTSSSVLELFRLLQEATLNAARHSGTDRVRIDIVPRVDQGVRLVVADQGRGGVGDRPGGYGLANMRRRAQLIGARLVIDSGSAGTSVILDLPQQLPTPTGCPVPADAQLSAETGTRPPSL